MGLSQETRGVIEDVLTVALAVLAVTSFVRGVSRALRHHVTVRRVRKPTGRSPDSMWNMGWAKRGRAAEKALGRPDDLADNFPVIDVYAPMSGRVNSIKSIDLTAKSYQRTAYLESKVRGQIDALADFNGKKWGGRKVEGKYIRTRVLDLAVEQGAASAEQASSLRALRKYAKKKKVELVIHELE